MIALALTILLSTDTIATSSHTIDEVVVVSAAGEGRKRSAKGQVASIDEHLAELLVLLDIDGAIALVAGQHTNLTHGLVNLVVDVLVVVGMMGKAETQ